MGKRTVMSAGLLVCAILIVVSARYFLISRTPEHMPTDTVTEEHASEKTQEEITFGEDVLIRMAEEAFGASCPIEKITVDFSDRMIAVNCTVDTKKAAEALSKEDDGISSAYAFLLQKLESASLQLILKQEKDASASVIFRIESLQINQMEMPSAFYDGIEKEIQSAFDREAEKHFSEIESVSIDGNGIHITGTAS